jgi:hypothetical protein
MIILPNHPLAVRGIKRPTKNKLVNAFTAQVDEWGAPCDEHHAGCPACEAWALFNKTLSVPSADEVMAATMGHNV